MLTAEGYECRMAGDGIEALAMLDSGEHFDLVFSNLMMSEMNGDELLERTVDRYPDMPFVLESACSSAEIEGNALRIGAFAYLTEPFTREQLLAVVRRALDAA